MSQAPMPQAFKTGDRVQITNSKLHEFQQYGEVTGRSRCGNYIEVLVDGNAGPGFYFPQSLTLVEPKFKKGDRFEVTYFGSMFYGQKGTIVRPWYGSGAGNYFDVQIDGRTGYNGFSKEHIKLIEKKEGNMNDLQEKVWQHLTSGEGDRAKRQEALKMLSHDGFFINEPYDTSTKVLKALLNEGRYQRAFCVQGRERVLALITPPKPKAQQRARLVVEFDITPNEGIAPIFAEAGTKQYHPALTSLPQVQQVLQGLKVNKVGLSHAVRTISNVSLVSVEEVK